MIKRFSLFIIASLFFGSQSIAQWGLHLQFLPNQGNAQYIQPAYIGSQDFKVMQLHIAGTGFIGNNQITPGDVLDRGEILEEDKDRMLEQIGGENFRTHMGYGLGGHVNFKALKRNWMASFRQYDGIYAGVSDSSSLGLILRGNAPYAGQRLTDDEVFANRVKYNEYALATGFSIQKVQFGVRAKYIQGLRANLIDDASYSLLTADDGTSIEVQSEYDFREVVTADPDGWGLGVDIGITYPINEKLNLQASLLDVGFIRWKGEQMKSKVDFTYEGTEIGGISGTDLSDGELFGIDTLQMLMFPDTVDASFNSPLASRIQVGMSLQLCERTTLHASLHQGVTKTSPQTQVPLVNVAYHYELNRNILVGANLYVGGIERYGLGAVVATDFTLGESGSFSLYGAADNITGLVVPSKSRGASLNIGMSVGW